MSVELHPIQTATWRDRARGACPATVTLRAYDVYKKVFGPQEALITGDCRGGFGTFELIAFLYARSFPESEWRQRFFEAIDNMAHERR